MASTLAQTPLADRQEAKGTGFSMTDVARFDKEAQETCDTATRLLAAIVANALSVFYRDFGETVLLLGLSLNGLRDCPKMKGAVASGWWRAAISYPESFCCSLATYH